MTTAIIKKTSEGSLKRPKHSRFVYVVDGEQYEITQTGGYDSFNIGDTILIEYAVGDHSVARVVDKYHMKKYRHLKK